VLRITIGPHTLRARVERALAPATWDAVDKLLPLQSKIIHARWSGEALWIPGGDKFLALAYENATTYPAPGEILLYPGGISEMEILVPYGATRFASKVGQLAGNHFATILESRETLRDIGHLVLWSGAQDVRFELIDDE
jgi:hypothetical protein